MRVLITTVQVPFVRGGGEVHAEGLRTALAAAGHEVEILTMPFRFKPASSVAQSMDAWSALDLDRFDWGAVDRAIHLKFPCYYAHHSNPVLWLLHQHRGVYELWDTPFGDAAGGDPEAGDLRARILARDTEALAQIGSRFANSRRVSERLQRYNGVSSEPLYHPPLHADSFYCAESLPFVFCPSRLEGLKRLDLLVEAMARVRTPLVALIAGEGGLRPALEAKVRALGLERKVRLLGRIEHDEMRAYYANCRAVFFGPYDEDLGYVTLEAMLSGKPVITCADSGGPLEFVVDGSTGAVCEPDAEAVAAALDATCRIPSRAQAMGLAGRDRYRGMGISWGNVVERLLA